MARLFWTLLAIGLITGVTAYGVPFLPAQYNSNVAIGAMKATQTPYPFTFRSNTSINAGTTFLGNLTLPQTSPASTSSYPSFYIITEDEYNAWMGSPNIQNGPHGGYIGTGKYIYNSITNTLSYPFHILSNTTTVYYFVFTASAGCYQTPCRLNLFESSQAWTKSASTILGLTSIIAIAAMGVVHYQEWKRDKQGRAFQ